MLGHTSPSQQARSRSSAQLPGATPQLQKEPRTLYTSLQLQGAEPLPPHSPPPPHPQAKLVYSQVGREGSD